MTITAYNCRLHIRVYGAGRAPRNMSNSSPKDIADDVYAALETNSELPPMPHNLETSMALLTFQLEAQGQDQSFKGQGREGQGCDNNQAPCENESESSGSHQKLGAEEDAGHSKGKKGQGRVMTPWEAENLQPSVLMLEALSRRRLDAVRQLHEACPRLLSSIPVFDPNPSLDIALNPDTSCQLASSEQGNYVSPSFSKNSLPSDLPPFRRSSRLLDRAAENKELLMFVLQNHPDIENTENIRDRKSACPWRDGKMIDDIYNAEHVNNNKDKVREVAGRKGKAVRKTSGCKDDEQQHKELCTSLDPNSPITVCLQKRNFDVLQYLLYRTVWQHFLLDDVFALPQSSQVPDLDPNKPRSSRPEIDWFLHCCTLMGCSQLLQRVLAGNFGSSFASHNKGEHANGFYTISGTYLPIPNTEPGTSFGNSDKKHTGEFIELYEEFILEQAARAARDDTKALQTAETSEKSDPNRKEDADDVAMNEQEHSDEDDTSNVHEVCPHPSSPETTTGDGEQPLDSDKQEQTKDAVSPTRKKHQKKSQRANSKASSSGGAAKYCPDPNTHLPVSLPVMDRWISRCMHLSCTPLHLACWRCDAKSIRLLLNHGADVNALAEELENPDDKDGDKNSGGGCHTHDSSSVSSEVSYIELAMANTSPFGTLTSNSFEMSGSLTSVESALWTRTRGRHGVTALALLALGVRSPPDFSLSIGRALGLVLPVLPELSPGGQTDRSCPETRARTMEALKLLLDAGAEVNAFSTIFRKTFRPLELFLQPSVDLYYAPLMPRGGRDSAVLRCMDLERVAELVLSACWELCTRRGRLGPVFAASLEWILFRMDWMFLQNETMQRKFTHLAIFLGLFPSMAPHIKTCSCFPDHPASSLYPDTDPLKQRNARVSPATFNVGWGSSTLHPDIPPRPSCVPWSRPQDDTVTDDSSPEFGGSRNASVPASHTDVTNPPSSPSDVTFQPSPPDDVMYMQAVPGNLMFQPVLRADVPSTSGGMVATYYNSRGTMTQSPVQHTNSQADAVSLVRDASSPIVRSRPSLISSPVDRSRPTSAMGMAVVNHRRGCPQWGITPYAAQMAAWASEERQRKVLERFVTDIVRLSVPQRTLSLLLRFLSYPDLRLMAELTDRMAQAHDRQDESTWERLREAVRQAQTRTLRHACKVAILMAVRWRYLSVQCLPLPESLKRYLHDSQC